MRPRRPYWFALCVAAAIVWPAHAQNDDGRRSWRHRLRLERYSELDQRTIFPSNVFTFCRIRYSSHSYRRGWDTDYPESDHNFSIRLSQLTTIEVNRDERGEIVHVVKDLTDADLYDYPFIYMLEVGALSFSPTERERLRDYLLRGGFLLVDDFWGEQEWANWEYEISEVFPPEEYPMEPIPSDHEIFRTVFHLDGVPQVPALNHWVRTRTTYERYDAQEPHLYGIEDKNGRLMVVVAHNTDLGDGWEREAWDEEYFREFSAKRAYPMGINIVVYAMTH